MKKQIYTKAEYLELINDLIKNSIKLGNKTSEAFIRNHTDFYTEVIALDIDGIFQEKLYSYLGFNRPICGNEACNNLTKFIDLRYGYREFCGQKCATTSKKVQDKIKKTCLIKYGHESHNSSNIIQEKFKNTMLERYGVTNPSQLQEIKEKKENTSLKNRGTKYYTQSKEYIEKSGETFFKNHGVYNGFQLIAKNNRIKGFEKLRVEGLDYNLELISVQNNTITYKCKTTDTIFSINRNTYKLRKKQQKTINLIELPLNNKISSLETQIFEYVSSLNSTFKQSDTNILEGKEVDIISYDLNLGIEFNGLYWHSNLFKETDYHLNKTIACNNSGIDLLHIFEDEWLYKRRYY